MRLAILTTIVVIASGLAETAVVFETTFNSLPAGWFNNEWTFSPSGANIYAWVYNGSSFTADMYTNGQPPMLYFVPDGTDSLVIHIEHDINMSGAYGAAFVRLYSTSFADVDIFCESFYNDGYFSTDPIHYVIVDPPPDTWIGFRLHGYVSAGYPEYSTIDWCIFSMTATAHGEALTLEMSTWASIKNSF